MTAPSRDHDRIAKEAGEAYAGGMFADILHGLTAPFRAMREARAEIAAYRAAGLCLGCGKVAPPPGLEACGPCHNENIAP